MSYQALQPLYLISVVSGVLFGVYRDYYHKHRKRVGILVHVERIGVHKGKFPLDSRHGSARAVGYAVVVLPEVSVHAPAVAIHDELRAHKGEFLLYHARKPVAHVHLEGRQEGKDLSYERSDEVSASVVDFKPFAKRKARLDCENGFACHVEYVKFLKSKCKSLPEK